MVLLRLRELSSREYGELLALRRLEPLGYERDDIRAALAAQATITAWGGRIDLAVLVPAWQPPGATPEEMLALIEQEQAREQQR